MLRSLKTASNASPLRAAPLLLPTDHPSSQTNQTTDKNNNPNKRHNDDVKRVQLLTIFFGLTASAQPDE